MALTPRQNNPMELLAKLWKEHQAVLPALPLALMQDYNYQPSLTKKLDSLIPNDFNRETLYEMVLWKINRFPEISEDLIDELRKLAKLKNGEHKQARDTLAKLLACRGIALPMGSSILRFINPGTFQIIDDRVYRVLMPGKNKYPSKPANKITDTYIKNSIDIYFDYLDVLIEISSEKWPFHLLDRILYQLDIKLGNKIGE